MVEQEQSAFMLHSRPYRENQQLVDLLTEYNGKVTAIAYSGKTNKSNKKGLLQPFLPLKIVLKGHNQLKNLSRVEASGKSYQLNHHYLYSGFYVNELLVRLLGEHVICAEMFQCYQKTLFDLSQQKSIETILRQFEMMLLDELGLSIDFSPVFELTSSSYYYIQEQGFIPALDKLPLPCYDGLHLQAIAQQELSTQQVLNTYKVLMRQIINGLLDNKPLNSRKLFIKRELN
ncbi:DNA repair protein RecO [Colwelliaceae bacterium 6471]